MQRCVRCQVMALDGPVLCQFVQSCLHLHSTSVVHAILQYRCCNMLHVEKKMLTPNLSVEVLKLSLVLIWCHCSWFMEKWTEAGYSHFLNLQFYSLSCFSSVLVPLLKTPNLLLDHFEESFYCPHHPLSLCILFWLYLFFFFFKTGVKGAAWISVILMWWSFLFLLPYTVINAVFFHNVLNWCFNINIPSNFSSSSLEACDCVCIYGCIFHVCSMSCWLLFSVFSIATLCLR